MEKGRESKARAFNFLTPEDYDYYFTQLRKKNFKFVSKLDAEFEKNGAKNNNR
jgi:hypothetical protein